MDCSPPGSSVHGISQARILEWIAIFFSGGSSESRDQIHISCIGSCILYHWATREPPTYDIIVEHLPKLRNQHWYITLNYIPDFIWMSSVSPLRSFLKKFFNLWQCHTAYGILVLWPGIDSVPPAVEAQSLNHWTTREVPQLRSFTCPRIPSKLPLGIQSCLLCLFCSRTVSQSFAFFPNPDSFAEYWSGILQNVPPFAFIQCFLMIKSGLWILGKNTS